MTNDAKRFLALNAILHGYPILKVFDDSVERMADCLDLKEEEAEKLRARLDALPEAQPLENELTATFLNFYRNPSYAFVAMENNVIPLAKFAGNDLQGAVSDELRAMFLSRLLMDVDCVPEHVHPYIADGVLHCTPEAFQGVQSCMLEAYQLFLSGPVGMKKSLQNLLRKHTSLEHYTPLTSTVLVRILTQIVKAGINPTIYQQTLLSTPNLWETYTHTGCIMAFKDTTMSSVLWLLDVTGQDTSVVLSADMSVLQGYLTRDVKQLADTVAATNPSGSGHKIVYPGVS